MMHLGEPWHGPQSRIFSPAIAMANEFCCGLVSAGSRLGPGASFHTIRCSAKVLGAARALGLRSAAASALAPREDFEHSAWSRDQGSSPPPFLFALRSFRLG